MLAQFSFYATSHQPTLSQIEWHAAFVGRSSTYDNSNYLSAFLVVLNTFAGQILINFMYPLLLLAGPNLHSKLSFLVPKSIAFNTVVAHDDDMDSQQKVPISKQNYNFSVVRGELVLYENNDLFIGILFKVGCQLVIIQSIRVISVCIGIWNCFYMKIWFLLFFFFFRYFHQCLHAQYYLVT